MMWEVAMAVLLTVMAGGFVGALVHELTHAVAAILLADEMTMGWQGGIEGGPYVDFQAPSRWRSEVIRKAPLALGMVALATAVVGFEVVTLAWLFHAGFALNLFFSSSADLRFASSIRRTPE
jgi:hypothetical protein